MTFSGRLTPAQRAELTRRGQQQFRQQLAAEAEAEARRLQQAYRAQLQRLNEQLALSKLAGEGALYSARAIERAREQVREALNGLTGEIEARSRAVEAGGIAIGTQAGTKAMGDSIGTRFNQPSVEQIRSLVGYVDSPAFQAAMDAYGPHHGDAVADILLDGASRGVDPVRTARLVSKYTTDVPLFDALRTVRTVQIWSARQGSHEIYRANADVLNGWLWSAARDGHVCMSCRSQDGKIFPLSATLNDHHLGRCAPVPVTKTWGELGFEGGSEVLDGYETGIQRFEAMTDAEQIAVMGRAAWQAWKDGRFTLDQYAQPYSNPIYGPMLGEASLTQLVGPELAQVYVQQTRAA